MRTFLRACFVASVVGEIVLLVAGWLVFLDGDKASATYAAAMATWLHVSRTKLRP